MASSTHTPPYNLSKFGPDDRPSWIDDYNTDMRTIDTAISDGNQAVTGMATEITAIKNKLDTINTVFNYFNWNGTQQIALNPTGEQADTVIPIADSSQSGIGDNNVISATPEGAIINQEGTYLIWSTINISAFYPNNSNLTTALSLVYTQDITSGDPSTLNIIHGGFITPIKTENTAPQQMAQSLSLQPTAVNLRAGAAFMLKLETGGDDTTPDARIIHANLMESSTGIIKIR